MEVSVVVPVFNSCESLSELIGRIDASLISNFEIILVDDGSLKGTWLEVNRLSGVKVRGIRLSRNYGQHAALLAGIREARFPIIATLDDDLQNPPEEIARLIEELTEEFDLVYGVPKTVNQSTWRTWASIASKRIMKSTLGFNNAPDISSFRVFRSRLRDGFNSDLGPGVSIDSLLSWSTSRVKSVQVEHHERRSGTSNYNFWKLLRFMLDTVTGFSTLPLKAATGLGLVSVTLSLGVIIWVLGRPLLTGESVPGFPFLAATIAIFSGTQLLVLGVLGQYLGRIHFRVMNKPTYTIAERTDG